MPYSKFFTLHFPSFFRLRIKNPSGQGVRWKPWKFHLHHVTTITRVVLGAKQSVYSTEFLASWRVIFAGIDRRTCRHASNGEWQWLYCRLRFNEPWNHGSLLATSEPGSVTFVETAGLGSETIVDGEFRAIRVQLGMGSSVSRAVIKNVEFVGW